jgi:RecA/RadA recombinase
MMPKKKNSKEEVPATVPELVNLLNKQLGFEGLRLAKDMEGTFLVRRPCGIFSIDLATAGGLPAGTMCKIGGAEGLGKNYLADLYMAQNQHIHGNDSKVFIVSSEYPYDKLRGRDNGFRIALSKKEVARLEESLKRPLGKEEKSALSSQVGEVVLVHGLTLDETMETVLRLLESNLFHIGLIDSIDSLIPQEQQNRNIGDPKPGSSAMVQTDFMKRFHYVIGKNRKTLLLALGQARANMQMGGGSGAPKNTVNDPYSVKHGQAGKIILSRGGTLREGEKGPKIGKLIRWTIDKGKAGFHDGVSGEFDYLYASGADIYKDFVETVKQYIRRAGPYYYIPNEDGEELRVQGLAEMAGYFKDNPEQVEHIKAWIYREKGIAYTYHEEEQAGTSRPRGKKAGKKGRGKAD